MHRIVVLLLAGLVVPAGADPVNPCGAPANAVRSPYTDVSATGGGFECAPLPLGAGTLPTLRSNRAGSVAWWYCPSRDGGWHLNWAAVTAARLDGSNLLAQIHELAGAKDVRAGFDAVMRRNVRIPLSDPTLTPVWCPFYADMNAGAPAR